MVTKNDQMWSRTWRALAPIHASLIGASVLICIDVVACGCYLCSVLLCPLWFVASVVLVFVRRPNRWVAIAWVLIPIATLLLAVANLGLQVSIARTNADKVVRACESYRAANGRLPDRLDQLVPRYLNSVPTAKYCLLFGTFSYSPTYQFLYWYVVPPFGRMVYGFDNGRWTYID